MKYEMILVLDSGGAMWLKTWGGGRARRVCTVSDASTILRRTRRQVYRGVRDGPLEVRGKFLGEWLIDRTSVERLARRPLTPQPIPRRLQAFFPEYAISDLNAGADRLLVIGRLLETGGMDAIRWLFKRYKPRDIRAFLEQEGARLLSPRCLRWWSLALDARPQPLPAWRQADPWRRARG